MNDLPTLFFSYSHADESLRDQLELHLASLKRQNLISTWHDRKITAGSHIGNSIDANLQKADVILLLISPDFIASDYCYEQEMLRAMERFREGTAHVIPVILRPCDWRDLAFGELLASPRDAKAVTTWPNRDEAFLSVEQAIKAAVKVPAQRKRKTSAKSKVFNPASSKKQRWLQFVKGMFDKKSQSNASVKVTALRWDDPHQARTMTPPRPPIPQRQSYPLPKSTHTDPIKPRVLVVDSERIIADTLAMILNQSGFEARALYSAQKLLQQAPDFRPDMLISAVILPNELNGIEAAIQIRKIIPSIVILLFSGNAATADLLEEARTKGYEFEILAKPVYPQDLLNMLFKRRAEYDRRSESPDRQLPNGDSR